MRNSRPQRIVSGGRVVFVSQVRDPLDPSRRLQLRGDTEGEVYAQQEQIRRERREDRLGIGDPRQRVQRLHALGAAPLTAERAWREYVASKEPEARANYEPMWDRWFAPVFGGLQLTALTADVMKVWERHAASLTTLNTRKPMGKSTIFVNFALFRAAVRRHVPARLIEVPWGKWEPEGLGAEPKRERTILRSAEQQRAFILAARQHDERARICGFFADLEYRVTVLLLCGLRNGELGGLGWDDLDLDGGIMMVRHATSPAWRKLHPDWPRPQAAPKGRKRAKRPDLPQRLHPEAIMALRAQRAQLIERGWLRSDGPVFPDTKGRHQGSWRSDECTVKPELMRELGRRIGMSDVELKNFVTHSTRHTFASVETAMIVAAGGGLQAAAERTRHRDLSVLRGYMHRIGGHGLVEPSMPMLDLQVEILEPSRFTEPQRVGGLLEPSRLDVASKAEAVRVEVTEIAEEEVRYSKGTGKRWPELARAWIAAGKPGVRPPEVTKDLKSKYGGAYVSHYRSSGGDRDAAKRKAIASRKASEGRWQQIVRAIEQPTIRAGKKRDEDGGEKACG